MTLEQIYFISQIAGAVVLIGSIIFLALQLRQNTRTLQRMMTEDFRTMENALFDEISRSREFAEFHMRIGTDYDSLDEIDKYRALSLVRKNTSLLCHSIRARLDGLVSDEDWQEIEARLRTIAGRKNVHAGWPLIKHHFPQRVRDVWEGAMKSQ